MPRSSAADTAVDKTGTTSRDFRSTVTQHMLSGMRMVPRAIRSGNASLDEVTPDRQGVNRTDMANIKSGGDAKKAKTKESKMSPGQILSEQSHATPQPEWASGLKRLYNSVVEEPLPDSFADLIAKL